MVPFNFYQLVIVGLIFLILVQCTNINNPNYENAKNRIAFNSWLTNYKKDAKTNLSVSEETLNNIFKNVKYNNTVIAKDSRQAEFTLTAEHYFNIVLPPETFSMGKSFLKEHWEFLNKITEKYHVPPYVIIAFLGIETRYGTKKPSYNAAESIANLAFNPRRSRFFTNELNSLVILINKGYISPEVKSSWAGALGYPQFMPSTYLYYGIDGSGNGIVDIVNSYQDTFASVANFLRSLGWNYYRDWGYEVILPKDFNYDLINSKVKNPIFKWRELGIKRVNQEDFPNISALAKIVTIDNGKTYLVTSNFDVITKWNKSTLFAIAVGTLIDNLEVYSKTLPQKKEQLLNNKIQSSNLKNNKPKIAQNNIKKSEKLNNTLKPRKDNIKLNNLKISNSQDWLFEEKRRLSAGEEIK